ALLGSSQDRIGRVTHHARHGGHCLVHVLAFHDKNRIDQVVRGQDMLADQAPGKIVTAVSARTAGRKVGGNNERCHGTTLGEIQFSMWCAASSRPMRSVAENGTATRAPISASSFLTVRTALRRCPYGSLSALVNSTNTGLPVGAIHCARRRSRSVTPRRMSISRTT